MEVTVLKRLQGVSSVCDFIGCGKTEKVNYVVMSLLGPNLSELRKRQPQQKLSVSTVLRLAVQIVAAVQAVHNCGFLHRDLKPSNFAMGSNPDHSRRCYILDFGLARQYTTPTGELRQPRPIAGFRGTVRYASVNAHKGHDLGRHDDLWSVFYLLIELATGQLPWKKIRNREEVGDCKLVYDHRKLIAGLPIEFRKFHEHLKTLNYFLKPDYAYIVAQFEQAMTRLGVQQSDPFDWEENNGTASGTSGSALSPAVLSQAHQQPNAEKKDVQTSSKTHCSEMDLDQDNLPVKNIVIAVNVLEQSQKESSGPAVHPEQHESGPEIIDFKVEDSSNNGSEHLQCNTALNHNKLSGPEASEECHNCNHIGKESEGSADSLVLLQEDKDAEESSPKIQQAIPQQQSQQQEQQSLQEITKSTIVSSQPSPHLVVHQLLTVDQPQPATNILSITLHPHPPHHGPPPGYFCASARRRRFRTPLLKIHNQQ